VEELLRKLLLSAVVVLIDEGSPLQVTLAVLVSGWAHVLHAQYKPWGGGSVLYSLQHGALFVTSFVFLMGLLFKVDGVSSSSGTYTALSGVMVALCAAFMAVWLSVIIAQVVSLWRALKRSGKRCKLSCCQCCAARRPGTSRGDGVRDERAVAGDAKVHIGPGDSDDAKSEKRSLAGRSVATRSGDAAGPVFVVENPVGPRRLTRASSCEGHGESAQAQAPATSNAGGVPTDIAAAMALSSSQLESAVPDRLWRVLSAQRPVPVHWQLTRVIRAADATGRASEQKQ
jgi:hypothetical protein